MKLQKKVLSGIAALALVLSMSSNVSAATEVADFEDGNYGFISMMEDDGADPSELSVVDLNGTKVLKVDVQKGGIPKVQINVAAMVNAGDLDKIKTIEFDLVIENPSGDVVNWNGGAIGSNSGADAATWSQTDWSLEEYNAAISPVTKMSRTFKAGEEFVNDTQATYLFMKWANNNDMYLDNIRFLTADGTPVALNFGGETKEVAKEETTDDSATTDSKDSEATLTEATTAEATSTDAAAETLPQTGTAPVAIYFVLGGALIIVGIAAKKRSMVE
jgi:LPXTG-motif cell wall-anchored protein